MRPYVLEPRESRLVAGAFTAAVLISGDLAQAEAAFENTSAEEGDEFLLEVLEAAIEGSPNHADTGQLAWALPPELRGVLHLPRLLRHCFVLRALLCLSDETCARLLHLQPGHIRHFVSLAAIQLARLNHSN